MRIFFFALAFYLVALAVVDTVSYNGRYRLAVWNEASYQVYRVQAGFKSILDRFGVGTVAVARP